MAEFVLEVKNLTKKFNGSLAVNSVSFNMEKGEILGLLGPNGAGKTTTIMMLLGITAPTSGRVKIFGLDFSSNREKILSRANFSSAYSEFPSRLTVFENLYIYGRIYNVSGLKNRITELLGELEISGLKNAVVGDLSSGQITRVGLCKAFLNEPDILFLDEPTASLDPEIARKVRSFLFKMRKQKNVSILYTSHNMEEVAEMCDRVIFLDNGKIVAMDTPLNLTKAVKDSLLILAFEAKLSKVKRFCRSKKLNFKIPQFNVLEINLKEDRIGNVLTGLARAGISITDIRIERPDLKDVFLKIADKEYEFPKN